MIFRSALNVSSSVSLARPPWWEAIAVTLIISGVAIAWIVSLGGLALSWDSLNHHFYLGWMAVEGNRLAHDTFAAGSMSCQYPYAYAMLYQLQLSGATGTQAAIALAVPAFAAIPAVWLIAWTFLPSKGATPLLQRASWVVLGFASPLWWSLLDTTSNDLVATLPIAWAFALIGWRGACQLTPDAVISRRSVCLLGWYVLAGALTALALMIKVSSVFAAIGIGALLVGSARDVRSAVMQLVALCGGGVAIALLVWWPWARGVWVTCGSPFYPMLADMLRPLTGVLP
ncbi:MAG: hypothetical protein EOP24_34195 [Hyphomicrobiales bacterium]|nr:MAG: hypothetical protein EOP24_34195 [Hyphomicrobiales bacterium]